MRFALTVTSSPASSATLVPCHPVVQANGRLGGYAAGAEVKRWLLGHEAAHAPALRVE